VLDAGLSDERQARKKRADASRILARSVIPACVKNGDFMSTTKQSMPDEQSVAAGAGHPMNRRGSTKHAQR